MKKYLSKWAYGEWINGSGWRVQSDIDSYDFDTLEEAEWDEEGCCNFIIEQDQLRDKTRDELEELATADSSDIKYFWIVSEWDEKEGEYVGIEDKTIEIWLSDIAKKVLTEL